METVRFISVLYDACTCVMGLLIRSSPIELDYLGDKAFCEQAADEM